MQSAAILGMQASNDYDCSSLKTIHYLFERQVKKIPSKNAIVFLDTVITYNELNNQANQLAHFLLAQTFNRETVVGIYLDREIKAIVAMLAVLKVGGAFFLIDANCPSKRIEHMIENSSTKLILTDEKKTKIINNIFPSNLCKIINLDKIYFYGDKKDEPKVFINNDNLACVIYTSGTTGSPKGVLLQHKGLVNSILNGIELTNINSQDIILCAAPFCFDAALWEIFSALLSGATLYLTSTEERESVKKLSYILKTKGITWAFFTPSVLRLLPSEATKKLRVLISGGEVCTPDLVKKSSDDCLFLNAYGPTENSICTTISICNKSNKLVDIGQPIKNVEVYILNEYLNPVTKGQIGTLYVGGDGLARGYINNPVLTQEKFIFYPINKKKSVRLYCTGDLVRINSDGNMEYIGRNDEELKICGNRANLNEIRHLLLQHPEIKNCMVKIQKLGKKNRIVAYIEVKNELVGYRQVRKYLSLFLPKYMLPNKVERIKAFPLSSSGKLACPEKSIQENILIEA